MLNGSNIMVELKTKNNQKPDLIFLAIAGFLVIWGIFTVGSASFPLALQEFGTPWYYLLHQLFALGIGLGFGFLFYCLPLEKIKKITPFLFLASIILLFFVFLPKIGVKSGGARRWINIGGFSFQPSEFLKITFILYISAWLSSRIKKKQVKNSAISLMIFFVILGLVIFGLLAQRHLSTLAIIIAIGIVLYFFSQMPWWHVAILIITCLVLLASMMFLTPFRMTRVTTFLNPQEDPLGRSWQLNQAAIALGSGGLFGVGDGMAVGLSRQKFGFLPEATTDSIFAIVGEEMGFAGALLLIAGFLFFFFQTVKIALRSQKDFERLIALGIGFWITLQALLNIGGITGIIPLGGIPLPFFTYGGSHLFAELVGVGILANISKQTKKDLS